MGLGWQVTSETQDCLLSVLPFPTMNLEEGDARNSDVAFLPRETENGLSFPRLDTSSGSSQPLSVTDPQTFLTPMWEAVPGWPQIHQLFLPVREGWGAGLGPQACQQGLAEILGEQELTSPKSLSWMVTEPGGPVSPHLLASTQSTLSLAGGMGQFPLSL